jgi:hypothetical protein
MISLAEVVMDSDLAEAFTILRSRGWFELGGWKTISENVCGYGIITVSSDQDLQMIPEGDRISGAMTFHSYERIYETQLDGGYGQQPYGDNGFDCDNKNKYGHSEQHVSDQIQWRGQLYRIISIAPWKDFGYWRAIGVRMSGR